MKNYRGSRSRLTRFAVALLAPVLIAGAAPAFADDDDDDDDKRNSSQNSRFSAGVYSYGGNSYGYGGNSYGYGSNSYGYGNNDQNQYIRCQSEDFRRATCRTNGKLRNVRIYDRLSQAKCQQGSDWGFNDSLIWVQNGCRAIFRVTYQYSNYGYGGGGYGNGGYGNNGYGYGNGGYGGYGYGNNYGLSRDIAVGNCIGQAERQLYRDGFRNARFERIQRADPSGNNWRIDLIFRVPHDNHFHYPVFSCNASRNYTELTRYDWGQAGRQCGFNFRLSKY